MDDEMHIIQLQVAKLEEKCDQHTKRIDETRSDIHFIEERLSKIKAGVEGVRTHLMMHTLDEEKYRTKTLSILLALVVTIYTPLPDWVKEIVLLLFI